MTNEEKNLWVMKKAAMERKVMDLNKEERQFLCDMGVYNSIITGYLIKAMENAGCLDEEIERVLGGLDNAFDMVTAAEADLVYQNYIDRK